MAEQFTVTKGSAFRIGDAVDQIEHLAHRGAVADDVVERGAHRFAERARLAPELRFVQRAAHEERELLDAKRLGHIMIRAAPDRLDGRVDGAERGHHDDGDFRRRSPRQREKLEPVRTGYSKIGNQHIVFSRCDFLGCIFGRKHEARVEAMVGETIDDHFGHCSLIVDDENARLTSHVDSPRCISVIARWPACRGFPRRCDRRVVRARWPLDDVPRFPWRRRARAPFLPGWSSS